MAKLETLVIQIDELRLYRSSLDGKASEFRFWVLFIFCILGVRCVLFQPKDNMKSILIIVASLFIVEILVGLFMVGCIMRPKPSPPPPPIPPEPTDPSVIGIKTYDENGRLVWIRPLTETLWPSCDCPEGFQHGNQQEDVYRQECVDRAVSGGIRDTLRVILRTIPNPELAIHLLNYESNVDVEKGCLLPGFFGQAPKVLNAGKLFVIMYSVTILLALRRKLRIGSKPTNLALSNLLYPRT